MARRTQGPKPRLIDDQKRVILPNEVLKALSAKEGDYVAFTIDENGVHLNRVEWVLK